MYCDECNCKQCHNSLHFEAERKTAIEVTLERNPRAFRPKIAVTATASPKGVGGFHHLHPHHSSPPSSLHSASHPPLLSSPRGHADGAGPSSPASALFPPDGREGEGGGVALPSLPTIRQVHHRGCHCKKSFCLKKYCEVHHTTLPHPLTSFCHSSHTLSSLPSSVLPSRHRVLGELQGHPLTVCSRRTGAGCEVKWLTSLSRLSPTLSLSSRLQCLACKNFVGSVERLALEAKGQIAPTSSTFLPPSAAAAASLGLTAASSPRHLFSGEAGQLLLPMGHYPQLSAHPASSSSLHRALDASLSPALRQSLSSEVMTDLTRSLLLAAHQHSGEGGDGAAKVAGPFSGPMEASTPSEPLIRPPRLELPSSSSAASLGDSDQAVQDLLLLASPQHSQLAAPSAFPPFAAATAGSNRRRRSGDEGRREGAATGDADEAAEDDRRKRIKLDAMAEVQKAMQLAAQAQTQLLHLNGASSAAVKRTSELPPSLVAEADPLLCTEGSAEPPTNSARPPPLAMEVDDEEGSGKRGKEEEAEQGREAETREEKRPSTAASQPLPSTALSPRPLPPLSSPPRLLSPSSASATSPSASSSTLTEFATFLKRMLAQRARVADDFPATAGAGLSLYTAHQLSSHPPPLSPLSQTGQQTHS